MSETPGQSESAPSGGAAGAAGAPSRAANGFMVFLIGACLVLCFIVIRQKKEIEGLQVELQTVVGLVGKGSLGAGELVTPLDCFTLDGQREGGGGGGAPGGTLDFGSQRPATVVMVFGGSCGACEAALPRMGSLTLMYARTGVVFAGIQGDAKEPADLKPHGTLPGEFRVRGVGASEGTWLKRVPLVPTVFVIDSSSRIRGAWHGIASDAQWEELTKMIELAANGWK